jgi:protein-tyrosine phosphatase
MVKTSVTHPLRVDWLETGRARSVGLTIAPGKQSVSLDSSVWKRDLAVDIDALVNQGATHLVCLLEDADLRKLGLTALPEVTRFAGLVFMHFPIRDVDVPDGIEPLERLLDEIDAAIEAGGRVVIHCQGGLGRTGTVAGCYLVRRGLSKEAALAELVRVRRDKRCPETDAQRAFIGEYARIRALRATPSMADVSIAHGDARPSPAPRPSWYLHSWLDGNVDDSLTELRADVQRGKKSGREVGVEVARIESVVREGGASHFDFNIYGSATLRVDNQRFRAGHFETPTLGELRGRLPLRARGSVGHALRLSVVEGIDILTDIGTLQATAPEGTLFQVASQFNCLEAPSSAIVPVARYVSDPTQGPRAAISAFPGALLRHYASTSSPTRFLRRSQRPGAAICRRRRSSTVGGSRRSWRRGSTTSGSACTTTSTWRMAMTGEGRCSAMGGSLSRSLLPWLSAGTARERSRQSWMLSRGSFCGRRTWGRSLRRRRCESARLS